MPEQSFYTEGGVNEHRLESLEREISRLAKRVDYFVDTSTGEFYFETIENALLRRRYAVDWVRNVLEKGLRRGEIWRIPMDTKSQSIGYVAVHCGHLDKARTVYFVVFTTDIAEAVRQNKPVHVYMLCPRCYRRFLKELKEVMSRKRPLRVWDPELGHVIHVSYKPVILYVSRWFRKGKRYNLILIDLVSPEVIERARNVLKEWIWRRVYHKGMHKRFAPRERVPIIYEIWYRELEELADSLTR